ncbi:F-box/kelch-repeat protein At3g06240-like [Salvia miltiorrhiza]|uniref:F-box/kelch-repeat protein At3g06240-like n=1 Tax=Salvia miltiorrhiza TaxID=226208 RepID=UPI0025AB659F|nr:F-box/kelch-repeat protein At3g06240-like [Salvia miltiorrhiza]
MGPCLLVKIERQIESSSQPSLHLPEEIIGEILPRLPVKSLLRFRVITQKNSDEWPMQCSLLSILSGPTNTIPLSPLADPTNTTVTGYEIIGCCNGLLCIVNDENIFQLWNPSTRISKKLPKISNADFIDRLEFGWVESIDEYKVFVIVHDYNSSVGKVYSSKTKSWKTIELCDDLVRCWPGGVFAGGKLYLKNGLEKVINFLDLKSEVFGRIELPFDQEKYGKVGVLGGFLCVLCFNDEIGGYRVWVMKESWEKVVTLSHLLELLQPPLVKGLNGDILVNCGSILGVYDCRDNVFRDLSYCSCYQVTGISSHEDCVGLFSHDVYVESLVSPEDL